MSADLGRDLGAWERQELSREHLLAVHGTAAAALVTVHERLTGAAAAVAVLDAEAGWAALLARIDASAPVVPLHRRRPSRTISIAIAAALALAGIAYAAVHQSHDGAPGVSPAPTAPSAGSLSGTADSNDRRSVPAPNRRTASSSAGGERSGGQTSGHDGSGRVGPGGWPKPGDDPHDRDQGTGNDGSHNDHGSGNDGPEGSRPPTSHGQ